MTAPASDAVSEALSYGERCSKCRKYDTACKCVDDQMVTERVRELEAEGMLFGSAVCQARKELGYGNTTLYHHPLERREFRRFP